MITERSQGITTRREASHATRPLLLRLPTYAYLGAAVNIASWACSWGKFGSSLGLLAPWRYTFFPLWLGFILFLDGVNFARSGTSPLTRSKVRFVAMFLCSSPFWWSFEGLNVPVQNWHYRLDHSYSPLGYFFITSLDFATVLPAVMEIAELLAGFEALRPRLGPANPGPRLSNGWAAALFGIGIVMLVLPFMFPRYTFGLIWLCLIFLLDPINNLARRKSAFGHLLARDWRFLVAVPLAALCCGFFWEMWNSHALPGWYYTVPFVDALPHLFEMPLPGYLGYLPFALELFAMYQFILLVCGNRKDNLTF